HELGIDTQRFLQFLDRFGLFAGIAQFNGLLVSGCRRFGNCHAFSADSSWGGDFGPHSRFEIYLNRDRLADGTAPHLTGAEHVNGLIPRLEFLTRVDDYVIGTGAAPPECEGAIRVGVGVMVAGAGAGQLYVDPSIVGSTARIIDFSIDGVGAASTGIAWIG